MTTTSLDNSILGTIKSLLGPDANYDVFDTDIIVFINSALATLTQLGVGPANGFRISGGYETWEDFIGNANDLDFVKEYIYLRTRIGFDPPANSSVLDAYKEAIKELEWRLNVAVDPSRLE